jgi:NadR type nicotinamide-nucleotide adenylyltransferase
VTGRILRVVVTGTECTGKTTLTSKLADRLSEPWSAEFVREYLARKAAPLTQADVEPIARGQLAGEDAAIARARQIALHDTDLLSTTVYARHYYEACPTWIEEAARRRLADLYLLLQPDVPWVADGLQRDRPHEREHLHEAFRSALAAAGARVVEIRGDWEARSAAAQKALDAVLADWRSRGPQERG